MSNADSISDGDPGPPSSRADRLLAAGRLSTTDARRIADALVWRHAEAPLDRGRTLDIPTLVSAHSVAISRIASEIPELAIPELRAAGKHQADWLLQYRSGH